MENINVLKYLTDSNIAEFIIAILLLTLVYALIRNGIKAKSKKMPLYLLGIFSIFILLSFYKTLMFPYLVSCGLFIFSLYVFYKQFIRGNLLVNLTFAYIASSSWLQLCFYFGHLAHAFTK